MAWLFLRRWSSWRMWFPNGRRRAKRERKKEKTNEFCSKQTRYFFSHPSEKGELGVLGKDDDDDLPGFYFFLSCLVTGDLGPLAVSLSWPFCASPNESWPKHLCKAQASGRGVGAGENPGAGFCRLQSRSERWKASAAVFQAPKGSIMLKCWMLSHRELVGPGESGQVLWVVRWPGHWGHEAWERSPPKLQWIETLPGAGKNQGDRLWWDNWSLLREKDIIRCNAGVSHKCSLTQLLVFTLKKYLLGTYHVPGLDLIIDIQQ